MGTIVFGLQQSQAVGLPLLNAFHAPGNANQSAGEVIFTHGTVGMQHANPAGRVPARTTPTCRCVSSPARGSKEPETHQSQNSNPAGHAWLPLVQIRRPVRIIGFNDRLPSDIQPLGSLGHLLSSTREVDDTVWVEPSGKRHRRAP